MICKFTVLKRSPSSRADQQASFLRERMSEYKTAAFNAKKKGDIELAKKYLRLAKVCKEVIFHFTVIYCYLLILV